jgi:hypothetical protein
VEKREAGIILICHRPDDMVLCDEVSPPPLPPSSPYLQLWEIADGQLLSRIGES